MRLVEADIRDCARVLSAAGCGGPDTLFELVVDKSTVDAILCDTVGGVASLRAEAAQVARLLAPSGCFCMITFNRLHDSSVPRVAGPAGSLPFWLDTVICGLSGDGNSGAGWALEVYTRDTGPTVCLFRRTRRSARSEDVGCDSLQIVEYDCE